MVVFFVGGRADVPPDSVRNAEFGRDFPGVAHMEVPQLGAGGEAVEGGHEGQDEAVHAVEVAPAPLVVLLPVDDEVGELGLPGVARAVGEEVLRESECP